MARWGLFRSFFALVAIVALSGCETAPRLAPAYGPSTPQASIPPSIQCVPYARRVSGIAIHGNAWTWWRGAYGHYRRGQRPRLGAVLVWRSTRRLPLGHVAVVSRIFSRREIVVVHTHWPNEGPRYSSRVLDVSTDNSWRDVRVWNERTRMFGAADPTYGFIYRQRVGEREASTRRR